MKAAASRRQRPAPSPGSRMAAVVFAALSLCASMLPPAMAADAGPADKYPDRPVRIVVPYSPGGGTDIIARLIGLGLTRKFGQAMIIDNRPGAATAVGTDIVSRAPADGYTMLMTTGTFAVLPALYPKLAFDPVRSFAPVSLFASSPNVLLVHPSVPAKTLKEFIAYAKSRPDPLNYGSSGNGGTGHLSMELLKQMTGVRMVHIPYKSGAPAMSALLAGEVSAMVNNVAAAVPQIKAGTVRALGVTTTTRSAALPEVPTIAEAGLPDFDASAWFGAFMPADTPAPVVEKMSAAINEILKDPDVQKTLAAQGVDAVGDTPAEFAGIVAKDVVRWKDVVTKAGIKPD